MADDYGEPDDDGNWTGLVGELHNRRADIGIGAIHVMGERESVIDYTVPYYDLVGYSILMKKAKVIATSNSLSLVEFRRGCVS